MGLLDRLPDGADESDTERDGFLSYSGEWHSFTIGVYRGLTVLRPWEDEVPDDEFQDVNDEPWYYRGGFVAGTLLQLVAIGVLAYGWVVFGL